jgi:uncharacterized protein
MSTRGDWLQTASGIAFHPADPRPEDVHLYDIAHALSNLCRFGGHCSRFYSVAEHSVLVSQCVPLEHALAALLHDATETYVVDVPRPVKRMLGEAYARLESGVWAVIAERFGVPVELPACVKDADNRVLLAERDELLHEPPIAWTWAAGLIPAPVRVLGLTPQRAAQFFLARFHELTRQRVPQ